jgi:hypothetical protein
MQVLDHIDQALAELLQRAAPPEPSPAPSGSVADALRALGALEERLGRLQAGLDGAARHAAGADAALAAEAGVLQEWCQQAGAVRESLASCPGRRE